MCVLNFIIYTHSLCNCPIPIIVTKRSYHHHHHRCHHQDDDDKSCGYCKDFTMLFHRHRRIDCCSSVHFGIFPSKCVRRVPTAVDATLLHDNQLARVRTCICVGENAVMPLHHCGCCCERERVRSNPALFLLPGRLPGNATSRHLAAGCAETARADHTYTNTQIGQPNSPRDDVEC